MSKCRTRYWIALVAAPLALTLGVPSPSTAQDWIDFVDATGTRLVSEAAVGASDSEEKDFAIGDFDRDCDTDLVVVRKTPFTNPGARRGVLFMNENGVLTDRSATLAPALVAVSDDRDVQVGHLNDDVWPDIVISGTFGWAPRVLMNRGRDLDGNWLGFEYTASRIPSFPIAPNFCSVAIGDVTGDGRADLYFVNYVVNSIDEPQLEDRLLINDGSLSPTFVDETVTRLTPAMVDSTFGTSALIADWTLDGVSEILKVDSSGPHASSPNVAIFYQNEAAEGVFDFRDQIYDVAAYMAATADFTKDGRLDLVIVDDGQDRYLINTGNDVEGRAQFSAQEVPLTGGTTGFGGSAHFTDMDGDDVPDAIISDVDVDIPGFDRRLTILRATGTPPNVVLTDPINAGRTWRRFGTFDAVGMHVDKDRIVDLVVGAFDGTKVYIGTKPSLSNLLLVDGFELENTGCWSSAAP